jgi:hypothetical protein
LKSTDAAARARGQAEGGAAALAAARTAGEMEYGDYTNWKGDVTHRADEGGRYAGQAASIRDNAGRAGADIETGWGRDVGGVYTGTGKALADYTGTMTGRMGENAMLAGRLKAGVTGDMANLSWNYGQQQAAQANNYWNALAKSRDTGINNLFKIGGLAVQGLTGLKFPTGAKPGGYANYDPMWKNTQLATANV